MHGRLVGRAFLLRLEFPALPAGVPGRQVVSVGHTAEEVRHVRIILGISLEDRVVHVELGLPPRIEHDFFITKIWVRSCDDATDRVVELDCTDADSVGEFEPMGIVEEGLIPADRIALVIQNDPTAANPARVDDRSARDQWPLLGLRLFLNRAAEPVGIRKGVLHLGLHARREVGGVRFAGHRIGRGRLRLWISLGPLIRMHIIEQPTGRLLQNRMRIGQRIGHLGLNHRLVQVRLEACKRVAEVFPRLAHDGDAHDQAERVERRRRLIAVRVGRESCLQHTIVEAGDIERFVRPAGSGRNAVLRRIDGFKHQQVMRSVIGYQRVLLERVAEPSWQEEMCAGLGQFGSGLGQRGRVVGDCRRVEDTPRRNPPVRVVFGVDIARSHEHGIGRLISVHRGNQTGRKRELIVLERQSHRLQDAQGERSCQIIVAVQRAGPLDGPAIRLVRVRPHAGDIFIKKIMVAVGRRGNPGFLEVIEAK